MDRRDFWKMSSLGLLGMGGSALAQPAGLPMPPGYRGTTAPTGGDMALVNARIWTMDPAMPRAEAALVRNGRIVLVGSTADVLAQSQGVPRFDAGKRAVFPGIVDTHTHVDKACWTFDDLKINLTGPEYRTSWAPMEARLRRAAAEIAPGRWICAATPGRFWQNFSEKRGPITRLELDAISERHPIALDCGVHHIIMNTMAFKQTGLWDANEYAKARFRDGRLRRNSSDVARDANGVPTGVSTETYDLLGGEMYTPEQMATAIRNQVKPYFTNRGVTSAVNLPSTIHDIPVDHLLQASGDLPLRLRTYYIIPQVFVLDSLLDAGMLPGTGNDMWRFGGVKIFVAGAGYDAQFKTLADLKWTQEELDDICWRSHAAGYQLFLHESAHDAFILAMNAVEKAQAKMPRQLRHRLEHYSQLVDSVEIQRVKRAGMGVSITGATVRGNAATGATPRYATLIREGLQPVTISDSTGHGPGPFPLRNIACLASPRAEGGTAPEGEAPTFDQALAMWTSWAAYSVMEENDKGSITAGKLGDFIVVEGDPDGKKPGGLFDMVLDATILGGKVVYQR